MKYTTRIETLGTKRITFSDGVTIVKKLREELSKLMSNEALAGKKAAVQFKKLEAILLGLPYNSVEGVDKLFEDMNIYRDITDAFNTLDKELNTIDKTLRSFEDGLRKAIDETTKPKADLTNLAMDVR